MEQCPGGAGCASSLARGFAKLSVILSSARHGGTAPTLLLEDTALWQRFAALSASAFLASDPLAERFAAQAAALLLFPAADELPDDDHLTLLRLSLKEGADNDRLFSGGAARFFLAQMLCGSLGGDTLPVEFSKERHAETWAMPTLRALEVFLENEAAWPLDPRQQQNQQEGGAAAPPDTVTYLEVGLRPRTRQRYATETEPADAYCDPEGRSTRNARHVRDAVLALTQPSLHSVEAGATGQPGGLAGESAEVAEQLIAVLRACERVGAVSPGTPSSPQTTTAAAPATVAVAPGDIFPLEALQVPIDAAILHPRDPRVQAAAWGLLREYTRLLAVYSASTDRGAKALAAQLRSRWAQWAPRAAESAVAALDECLLAHEPEKAGVAVVGGGCGKLHQPQGKGLESGACATEIAPLLLCTETLTEYAETVWRGAAEAPEWQRALGKVRAALGRAAGERRNSGPGWARRAGAPEQPTAAVAAGEHGERLQRAMGAIDALLLPQQPVTAR